MTAPMLLCLECECVFHPSAVPTIPMLLENVTGNTVEQIVESVHECPCCGSNAMQPEDQCVASLQ